MGKRKQAGLLRVVRVPVAAIWPEPLTAFQVWAKKQRDGSMVIAAVTYVRQVYEALAEGQAVPVGECREVFDLAGALHDVACASGFGEAAGVFWEMGVFFAEKLEERG